MQVMEEKAMELPKEMMLHIFGFFNKNALMSAAMVNHTFQNIACSLMYDYHNNQGFYIVGNPIQYKYQSYKYLWYSFNICPLKYVHDTQIDINATRVSRSNVFEEKVQLFKTKAEAQLYSNTLSKKEIYDDMDDMYSFTITDNMLLISKSPVFKITYLAPLSECTTMIESENVVIHTVEFDPGYEYETIVHEYPMHSFFKKPAIAIEDVENEPMCNIL